MRPVVIGTAGHIDHGKTALVRRLTGIDTDRLKEEKERGISIDLGFAHLVLPSGRRAAIVDVPGHERFIKNMLAGATGIDLVLLVVAADEGVMPQTLEHFAIVDLLGVRRGVVALTKADLAPPERIGAVREEVRSLLADTPLQGAEIVPVSSVTGAGAPELLLALDRAVAEAGEPAGAVVGAAATWRAADEAREPASGRAADEAGPARLPVDRVFTIGGIGTVVTGTLWRGTIRPGDSLSILPEGRSVRVRQVQVHDEPVAAAVAGQRVAVALHGAGREEIARGDWLVATDRFLATDILDARLTLLSSAPKPLPTRTRVRVHLGASETLARVVLLQGGTLAPGASMLAQLRLEGPVVAVPGDRIVLRAYSPSPTIGGAVVLDPRPARRARVDEAGAKRLRVLESGSLGEKVSLLAAEARSTGVRPEEAALRLGVDPAGVGQEAAKSPGIFVLRDGTFLAREAWLEALGRIVEETARFGEKHRLRRGISKGDLKSALQREMPGTVFDQALEIALSDRRLRLAGDLVALPGSGPTLGPGQEEALALMERRLSGAGFQPPDRAELARGVAAAAKPAELLQYLVESGRAVRVTSEILYPAETWAEIEALVRRHFAREATLSVTTLKDMLQVSRKYAVPLLEHLDRAGLTLRRGDLRVPGPKLGA
jgi:selenocysteine-specific elongation factor